MTMLEHLGLTQLGVSCHSSIARVSLSTLKVVSCDYNMSKHVENLRSVAALIGHSVVALCQWNSLDAFPAVHSSAALGTTKKSKSSKKAPQSALAAESAGPGFSFCLLQECHRTPRCLGLGIVLSTEEEIVKGTITIQLGPGLGTASLPLVDTLSLAVGDKRPLIHSSGGHVAPLP